MEMIPITEHFQAMRAISLTSATTQIRHLGPGGKPGLTVCYLHMEMLIIEIMGQPEPETLLDSLWTAVRIEWATSGDVTRKYLAEFLQVMHFANAEAGRMETHARQQDATWKARMAQK
jgi:hypothetical protein